ncbi:NAD-dependent epimerase/dehydratase family protein [Fructobacillus sp. M158]|uniref:NAD-dependent epimerase/dehydratase family protein n=1 Tax=Fructobacillus parabroussonetiae TaxID=2713174 RepID=UPI00200A0466|nr:NAD-dependent epimerase/dehydratase family protein [Fructobacillus parabroussonetiae]MCK8617049.1 NAD-dependent epimerase/dehydratase family protein [Fructobacillus parabroussonetiae]
MTNILVLGGSGYIGQNLIQNWLQKDEQAEFYAVSRSGKGQLYNERLHYIQADVRDEDKLSTQLPKEIDYIINLVGRPESNSNTDQQSNFSPATVALNLAKKYHVKGLGFVQGKLGPKRFIQTKATIAADYKDSGLPVGIVNPTLVINGGRKDMLSKIAPVFKFLGLFSKKLKPVSVDDVVDELIQSLT